MPTSTTTPHPAPSFSAGPVATDLRAGSPFSSPPTLAVSPTEIEAFVLVFGVEEDTLGMRVDVSARCYEHRCDVSLAPLDGDVQRRLP